MNHPARVLTFTHAVVSKPICINPELLFGWYYSDVAKVTILLSSGTTTIPVKESVDEVTVQVSAMWEAVTSAPGQ